MDARGTARRGAFIGRRAQLAAFDAALARAKDATPTTLLISGEAGVGKTRLVGECSERARRAGAVVLSGTCVQLHAAAVPYTPVVDGLRGLVQERGVPDVRRLLGGGWVAVARLLPELDAAPAGDALEPWGQAQLFEAVLGLVLRLAAEQPTVLVADDLHWADPATLDLLNFLARNVAGRAVVVIGAWRTDVGGVDGGAPVRTWSTELLRSEIVERIELDRFGRAELYELLTDRAGAPPNPAVAEEIFRRSDGNAFFAEELLAAADLGGELPDTLRETLLTRVASLARPTQRVLGHVAVGGGRVRHDLLRAAVGLDEDDLLDALDEAVDHHVLVADGDSYALRHAAFAEAIDADLLPAQRVRIHSAFAHVLDAHPDWAEPAERAAHWLGAGVPERALAPTIEAAFTAERQHAHADALEHWERAIELWPAAGEQDHVAGDQDHVAGDQDHVAGDQDHVAGVDRVTLLDRAAEAANRTGALPRALALVDTALAALDATADAERAGHLHQRRGWYLTRSGRDDDALVEYEQTLALLPESSSSSRPRAVALASMGRLLARRGQLDEARDRCKNAIVEATATGATAEEGYARHALGLVLAAEGDADEAFVELVAAVELAEATGEVVELAWTCLDLLKVAARAHRLAEAVTVVLDRAERAHSTGLVRAYGGLLECIGAGGLVELGRWSEAERLTDAVAARGGGGIEAIALDVVRGTLDVGRGRLDSAAEHLRAAQSLTAGLHDGRLSGLIFDGLAELARARGRVDEARELVTEGLARVAHTGDDEMTARLCLTGVRVEVDATQRSTGGRDVSPNAERAGELLDRLQGVASDAAARAPFGEIRAAAATAAAEVERLHGRPSVGAWEAAVAAWEHLETPYPEATVRTGLAEALLGQGLRDAAEQALTQAHAAALALGARPLEERVEALARRARVSLTGAGGRRTAAEPADETAPARGLTTRELEVLQVLATGATNRRIAETLFISEKTVSIHVSRILAKLEVSTRGEAAAVAHRDGLVGEGPGGSATAEAPTRAHRK